MQRKKDYADFVFLATTILSLAIVGLIVIRLMRIQRGLLGFVLSGIAIFLVIYWMKEFRKTLREELFKKKVSPQPSKRVLMCDIFDYGSEMIVIAEIPGPEDKIKAQVIGHNLVIQGGKGFSKSLKLPQDAEVAETTYVNGVLQVRLRKNTLPQETA